MGAVIVDVSVRRRGARAVGHACRFGGRASSSQVGHTKSVDGIQNASADFWDGVEEGRSESVWLRMTPVFLFRGGVFPFTVCTFQFKF